MTQIKKKIAIIGAGIAGLNLAHLLADIAEIVVFEKSDKLGGRIATHQATDFAFDHGAQFFTAKSAAFKQFVKMLEVQGVVAQWSARFVELEPTGIVRTRTWDAEFPHYVGTPTMNAIGQYLAKEIDVRLHQLITGMQKTEAGWIVKTAESEHGLFDWVIVTTPAAQANMILPEDFHSKINLQSVIMQPCFALMLGFKIPQLFDWDAAFVSKSILSWVSVNSTKPNRAKSFSIVAMSTNRWAEENFAREDSIVMAEMLAELESLTGKVLKDNAYKKLKRWKYANAARRDEPLELIDAKAQLACCGDWSRSGRIESAFMASLQLAEKLKSVMI
jgi:renalase